MVEYSERQLNQVFHALADPSRRRILAAMADQQCSVSQLAEPLEMSLAAVSKHLKVLEQAGLLKRRKQGRTHFCRVNQSGLAAASSWVKEMYRFWNKHLDALDKHLKESK